MRINDKHHDVVLFELSADARKAGIGITSTYFRIRKSPGLDHIAFEVGSREDWLVALGDLPFRLPTSAGSLPTKPRSGPRLWRAANIKAE